MRLLLESADGHPICREKCDPCGGEGSFAGETCEACDGLGLIRPVGCDCPESVAEREREGVLVVGP